MNDEFFREHALRVRQIASFADPFTKKRLLDLAEKYEVKKLEPRKIRLPSVEAPDTTPSIGP